MLNEKQREAVEAGDGPVLVVAGAGSGKTRTIAHRVAYLTQEKGVSPRNIAAVTFTRKAADEMQNRLQKMVGDTAWSISTMTFHKMGLEILKKNGYKYWTVSDAPNSNRTLANCMTTVGVDKREHPLEDIKGAISASKNNLITPDDYEPQGLFEEAVHKVYVEYQRTLGHTKQLDFDDLIMRTVQLLQRDPEVRENLQGRIKYLLVDEFQDTNVAQYEMAKLLSGGTNNIYVVGDPDQSIYAFRSADIRNILNFQKDYPEATVVMMEQNYRSTQTILEAAHEVIQHNIGRVDKELWTDNEVGNPITVLATFDSYAEATAVADEVQSLTESDFDHKDCAVLYRTNAQSRALEEIFVQRGIPYRIVGNVGFYLLFEIKVLVSYLRVLHNPDDDANLAYILNRPARGIGDKSLTGLRQAAKAADISLWQALQTCPRAMHAQAQQSAVTFVNMIEALRAQAETATAQETLGNLIKELRYERFITSMEDGDLRWENVVELLDASSKCSSITMFLEKVAMTTDQNDRRNASKGVLFITLHQAKGLEFPVVFMVGTEDGILPHFRSFASPAQQEEERRLCYVGMTRAMKRLYMLRAAKRGNTNNPPSPFLKDIPGHLKNDSGIGQEIASRW